jgi:hypothetical protein
MPADSGPKEWQRIDVKVDLTRRVGTAPLAPGRKVDIVVPAEKINPVALDPITVSNARQGDQDFSFDVSKVGVPVLVKISYFPNWKVDGADGPYRVAPNFMVVIPRSTLIGIGLLFLWRYKGDVVHRSEHPFLVLAADGALDDEPTDGEPADGELRPTPDDDVGWASADATPVGWERPEGVFSPPDPTIAPVVPAPPAGGVDVAADQVESIHREQPDGPAGSV